MVQIHPYPNLILATLSFFVRCKLLSALCCLICLNGHRQIVVDDINHNNASRLGFLADNKFRHLVKNLALNQALERSGAVVWIVAFFCQKGKGLLGNFEIYAFAGQSFGGKFNLNSDDFFISSGESGLNIIISSRRLRNSGRNLFSSAVLILSFISSPVSFWRVSSLAETAKPIFPTGGCIRNRHWKSL